MVSRLTSTKRQFRSKKHQLPRRDRGVGAAEFNGAGRGVGGGGRRSERWLARLIDSDDDDAVDGGSSASRMHHRHGRINRQGSFGWFGLLRLFG